MMTAGCSLTIAACWRLQQTGAVETIGGFDTMENTVAVPSELAYYETAIPHGRLV